MNRVYWARNSWRIMTLHWISETTSCTTLSAHLNWREEQAKVPACIGIATACVYVVSGEDLIPCELISDDVTSDELTKLSGVFKITISEF